MALMVNGRHVDVQCGKPDTGSASDVRRGSMMHTCGSCLAKESSARCEPLSGSCMAGMHKKGIFSFFVILMQNLQAAWQGAPVLRKLASATDTQKHTACLLHKGVYT